MKPKQKASPRNSRGERGHEARRLQAQETRRMLRGAWRKALDDTEDSNSIKDTP